MRDGGRGEAGGGTGARGADRPARLDRALAVHRHDGTPSGIRDYGRREAAFLRKHAGRAHQLSRLALAPDQPEQLRQPVPRPGACAAVGQRGTAAVRRRKRFLGPAGRRDAPFALRPRRLLPSHGPAAGDGPRGSFAGFPDTQQLRHPRKAASFTSAPCTTAASAPST